MQTNRWKRGQKELRRTTILSLFFTLLLPVVCSGQTPEPIDTIRVDAELVDLKVSIVSSSSQAAAAELEQRSFVVLEDGKPQEISFFAAADTPFDLVLLLDLSGSVREKLKLVRKSAKRFVDETRPIDRVSVVSFTDTALVACPLTHDRELLKKSIDDIEKPLGGTNFWDSLRYVLSILNASGNTQRRSAVVVMTDGVDNALPDVVGDGSQTTFEQLLGAVRASETIVFPVYLDTEKAEYKRIRTPRRIFALAREQLAQLAVASGSRLYRADKLKDLDDVYKQVIRDLSRVYSIGYRPSTSSKEAGWRSVTVQITGRQDLMPRTKQGYYARGVAASGLQP